MSLVRHDTRQERRRRRRRFGPRPKASAASSRRRLEATLDGIRPFHKARRGTRCVSVCVCVCVCVWALRFILPNHASWRGWHEKRLSAVIVPMLAAFFFVISFFFFYAPARLTGLTMRTAQTRILFPSAVTRQVGRSLPLALVPHYLIAFSFHCWPFLFRLSFNGPMAGCGRGVLRGSCDVVRPAASASSSSSSPSTSSSPLSSSS